MTKFDHDLAVIGGGSGGYAAARTAASLGLNPLVLEGGAEVGGLCILRGCMPTKALLHAAEVLHLAGKASEWGVNIAVPTFDFAAVMARKNRLIGEFAEYRRQQLADGRFAFRRAAARFVDEHTVELDSGDRVTAAGFVIATGSVVAPPPLPQLAEIGFLTSDSALALTRLPKSILILGGGAVAVEFAQFFLRFGARVTLIQRSSQILKDFDADAAEVVTSVFRREGMTVLTGTKLTGAWAENGFKYVSFEHNGQTVVEEAEEIFHGLGRRPATTELALEQAGVVTEKGRILTNKFQQTTAPHIYAAGDCCGPHEIVHIAIQQGELAAHNLARPDARRAMDYRLLTSVVFTDPQVATVGLSERQALADGTPCMSASYPFNDHGKSLIMDAKDGFVKLLADQSTGEILGGSCVGPMGGELIHEIVAAMAKRMTVRELAALPHYHPTLAEIWTYPAEELADHLPPDERVG